MNNAMNACIHENRVNVGEKRVEKIGPKSSRLLLVKAITGDQILLGLIKNIDLHDTRLRMSSLACAQSEKCASPDAMRLSRS